MEILQEVPNAAVHVSHDSKSWGRAKEAEEVVRIQRLESLTEIQHN